MKRDRVEYTKCLAEASELTRALILPGSHLTAGNISGIVISIADDLYEAIYKDIPDEK